MKMVSIARQRSQSASAADRRLAGVYAAASRTRRGGTIARMTFIETRPEPRLDDPAREGYGYVPTFTAVFSQRPDVYAAWRALLGAIRAEMEDRRYELATVAAAKRLRSTYC